MRPAVSSKSSYSLIAWSASMRKRFLSSSTERITTTIRSRRPVLLSKSHGRPPRVLWAFTSRDFCDAGRPEPHEHRVLLVDPVAVWLLRHCRTPLHHPNPVS